MSLMRGLMVLLLAFAWGRACGQSYGPVISPGVPSGLMEFSESGDGIPGEEAGNERQSVAVTSSSSLQARPGVALAAFLCGALLLVAHIRHGFGQVLQAAVVAGSRGDPGARSLCGLRFAWTAHPATAPPLAV